MAKRFTDTAKWDKASFDGLSIKMKLVWIYLCDKCDHAGVWDVNYRQMSFHIGEEVTDIEMTAFGDKLVFVSPTKIFIPAFVEFQYGELNPENRVHKSILSKLKNEGVCMGLTSPVEGAKDKDTDKDKAKDQDKEKKEDVAKILFDLWNDSRGALPHAEKLTEKRRSHARAQLEKYPGLHHWTDVLDRWKRSEFCVTKWKPTFDDWLNENKRIATLEGRYDNREGSGAVSLADLDLSGGAA